MGFYHTYRHFSPNTYLITGLSIALGFVIFRDFLILQSVEYALTRIYDQQNKCDGSGVEVRGPYPIKSDAHEYGFGDGKTVPEVTKNSPFIFIGGFPRSGTTLMRVMLDVHQDVRCGEETHIIPNVLDSHAKWRKQTMEENSRLDLAVMLDVFQDVRCGEETHIIPNVLDSHAKWRKQTMEENSRLDLAGITTDVLDDAIGEFVLRIVEGHGDPAPILCNKDPLTMRHAVWLSQMFPNSKFVFMIRDGRAVTASLMTRHVKISGYNLSDPRDVLPKWSKTVKNMYNACYEVGTSRCLPMYYEQLVLHPRKHMKRLLNFLHVPWNESVLHHEDFIGSAVSLSKKEPSTSQVVNAVYLNGLTGWVGNFSREVQREMSKLAPMLSVLGYNPHENPPDYGKPDPSGATEVKLKELYKRPDPWMDKLKRLFPNY